MRVRLFRSRTWSYLLVAGTAAVVAGGGALAVGSTSREYTSTATLVVAPLSGTGDPDRVVATQLAVLQSRALRSSVSSTLGPDTRFALQATQQRLSNVVVLAATSPDPQTATAAVAAATGAYLARNQSPRVADVSVLDPASAPTPSDSASRDAVLAALAAGTLASALLLGYVTARPRVRRAYTDPPENALLIELPEPTGEVADEAASAALARLSQHLSPQPSASIRVSALPGVGESATQWVTRALQKHSEPEDARQEVERAQGATTVPDSTDPGGELAVVVARAWVDEERALRRLIAARRAFAEVLVVVLGTKEPALVPPRVYAPSESLLRGEEIVRRRARREGPVG